METSPASKRPIGWLESVQVWLGEVSDLDAAAREVVFNDRRLRFDSLNLATGSGSTYFGHGEWRELAPQRLPDWNTAAAGIGAYKFRDPEGHRLQLLQG